MISNFTTYVFKFKKEWGEDPVVDVCIKLLNYMYEQPAEQLQMITLYSVGKIVKSNPLTDDVIRAVTILVSSKFHALDQRHLFIDENDEFDLDSSIIIETQKTGHFVHPYTGEYIEDWSSKVVPYYIPSQEFLALKAQKE